LDKAGSNMPARIAMMAITTSNSIKVNARHAVAGRLGIQGPSRDDSVGREVIAQADRASTTDPTASFRLGTCVAVDSWPWDAPAAWPVEGGLAFMDKKRGIAQASYRHGHRMEDQFQAGSDRPDGSVGGRDRAGSPGRAKRLVTAWVQSIKVAIPRRNACAPVVGSDLSQVGRRSGVPTCSGSHMR
jgi:hypothetical protein